MIFDAAPFGVRYSERSKNAGNRAINAFLRFIEEKLGVVIGYDTRTLPFERPDLINAAQLGGKLQKIGVIRSFEPGIVLYDEPRLCRWGAVCGDARRSPVAGATWKDDAGALTAALAEGLERYIWFEMDDYFDSPKKTTAEGISKFGPCLAPERFAGFSDAQRAADPARKIDSSSSFLWIRGISLVSGKRTYLPAQTASGVRQSGDTEPQIRQRTTIGLATWPTLAGARLSGALEVIEREAYMIWWLNQLVLPRIDLEKARERSAALSELIEACERYRLRVHAIKLLTDAPTHAVCVMLEDLSGGAPRFSFGLKAHRSLPNAILKATTEALRARIGGRKLDPADAWNSSTPVENIGHYERLSYWASPENSRKLTFLTGGEITEVPVAVWENDSPEEHLRRVVDWCRASGFECVSVALGTSSKNITPWSVEMVVIPELQPTYLTEKMRNLGGTRWKKVPEHFGLKACATPFMEEPHPFA